MKRIICLIWVLMLMLTLGTSALASDNNEELLSNMSAEECIAFIKSRNIQIPNKFEDEMDWAPFVHDIIVRVEANPGVEFPFGYSVMVQFANQIKQAVIDYYGIEETVVQSRIVTNQPLQDNAVYGSWSDTYEYYNCYAYAIGKEDWIDPGVFDWVSKGNTSDAYDYNDLSNIYTIVCLVEDDLLALGYTVNIVSTTMPTTTVANHINLICVRKDLDGYYVEYEDYYFLMYDYHFMKLSEDGLWYHKPGGTNPLRYNYTPSNDRNWVSEYSIQGVTYRETELTYESEIYFIQYTTPHVYAYQLYGSDQHIKTCTICGETTGVPGTCIFINNVCKACGRPKVTSGNVVTSVCRDDNCA